MAKTRPKSKQAKKRASSTLHRVAPSPSKSSPPIPSPQTLLAQATTQLHQGDVEGSVTLAKQALSSSDSSKTPNTLTSALAALTLLGEIHVELGDIKAARQYFLEAAQINEEDCQGEENDRQAEIYLWLAQLSEEGGHDSVQWFEKGAARLRKKIQAMLDLKKLDAGLEPSLQDSRKKLAVALCSVVEVYMTDLSWEEDAEEMCEKLVTEATMVAPGIAEPWQTLANVRISQRRMEDAIEALKRSMDTWKDLSPEATTIPDFPTRVSLARLLMEASMQIEAIEVLERLVSEDDSSVEVWYLGGWGLFILGEKQRDAVLGGSESEGEDWRLSWTSSQQWLYQCLLLYDQQEYEDERLGAHARELTSVLKAELGGDASAEQEEDACWEDEDSTDDDNAMCRV